MVAGLFSAFAIAWLVGVMTGHHNSGLFLAWFWLADSLILAVHFGRRAWKDRARLAQDAARSTVTKGTAS